jgi:large subunit ribosomal protein L9
MGVLFMKVILLKDVKKQGKKDDVITVSDGYAQNYLIKNGLAIKYTTGSKCRLEQELDTRNKNEEALIAKCEEEKQKLEKISLKFNVKTGKEGKLFGTISSKQIADELNKKGFSIDKKTIEINNPIDSLGIHNVNINLHKKVVAKLKVEVKEV